MHLGQVPAGLFRHARTVSPAIARGTAGALSQRSKACSVVSVQILICLTTLVLNTPQKPLTTGVRRYREVSEAVAVAVAG